MRDAGQKRDSNKTEGQSGMRQHPQQRVHRIATTSQQGDRQRHNQCNGQRTGEDRHLKCQRQGHAQNCGMCGCITEIRHAAPHHETPKRSSRKRNTDTRERCPHHKNRQALFRRFLGVCIMVHDGDHARAGKGQAHRLCPFRTRPGIPVPRRPQLAIPRSRHAR